MTANLVKRTVEKTKSTLQPLITLQGCLPLTPWLACFSVPFIKNTYDLSQAFLSEIVSDGSFFDYYSQRTALVKNEILSSSIEFTFAFVLSFEVVGLLDSVYKSFTNSEDQIVKKEDENISYWQATFPFYNLSIPLMLGGIGLTYITEYDFL